MGNETGNGLGGMRMDRRDMKKLTRMGKRLIIKSGTNTEMLQITLYPNLTVFELGVITRG
jgi:hypothetical protein